MFKVLALGEFIQEEGIDISIGAFADLYHTVTSKHQKQMEMVMITKGTKLESIQQKTKRYQIENKIELINWGDQEKVETTYQDASILLLPSNENVSKLISESFSFGLPVISYDNEMNSDLIDPSCGMLMNLETVGDRIEKFSQLLKMLYFDPEARKVLKKGAMNKYKDALSWGFEEKRTNPSLATL